MSRKRNKAISEVSQDKILFSSKYIILHDRSVKIWKDWQDGKLSDMQYEILMNTTLKEIRTVIRNEQKAGKEEAEEGSN